MNDSDITRTEVLRSCHCPSPHRYKTCGHTNAIREIIWVTPDGSQFSTRRAARAHLARITQNG